MQAYNIQRFQDHDQHQSSKYEYLQEANDQGINMSAFQ
jgi:hypothetical protein